jgi:hypothetical protein
MMGGTVDSGSGKWICASAMADLAAVLQRVDGRTNLGKKMSGIR